MNKFFIKQVKQIKTMHNFFGHKLITYQISGYIILQMSQSWWIYLIMSSCENDNNREK